MYSIMLVSGVLHNDLKFATVWSDHNDKSSNHLSPYKVIKNIIDHIPYAI